MTPDPFTLKDSVETVQAFATIVAIIVGAIWTYTTFIRNRQRYPSVELSHNIRCFELSQQNVFVNVEVKVHNKGKILVSLVEGQTRIHQICPPPADLLTKYEDGLMDEIFVDGNIEWPLVTLHKSNWPEKSLEIEPGETHEISYDFILDARIQVVRIYSWIKNKKKRKRLLGWSVISFFEINKTQPINTNL